MLKRKTEEKEKTRENDKPWVFLKKGFGGGGGGETCNSNCRNPFFFCIGDHNTPLKNPRIAGKTALVVIISKQNNRHKLKKGKSTKKTEVNNTTTIKTATTEKPGPKCKTIGFGRGMRWKWPLRKATKLKKGRKKKKEDRTKSTKLECSL